MCWVGVKLGCSCRTALLGQLQRRRLFSEAEDREKGTETGARRVESVPNDRQQYSAIVDHPDFDRPIEPVIAASFVPLDRTHTYEPDQGLLESAGIGYANTPG